MKFLLLLLMLIPSLATAQSYSSLVGVTYEKLRELQPLKNCVQNEARVDTDGYLCKVFYDTINAKNVIVVEYENYKEGKSSYTILDVTEFDFIGLEEHLYVGSAEGKHKNTHRFVIAVDCCYVINKTQDWPAISRRVKMAWSFNKQTNKIERLNTKNMVREWDGFYWE